MKKYIFTFFVIFIVIFSMGCTSEEDNTTTLDGVINDYNPKTNQFENYNKSVTIKDKIQSIMYKPDVKKTDLILESNEDFSLYITKTTKKNPDDGDLTSHYSVGDKIKFKLHIKEDEYGEYIKELR